MAPSLNPRRSTRPSRAALVVASLAAAAALVVPVAITGLASTRALPESSAVQPGSITTDPATGERIVVDTVYVVTPDAALHAAAPVAGGGDREGDEHDDEED